MSSGAQGLCIDRVHVWRGDRHVLKGVSLMLDSHELLHISGPNGTGKTTLLRVASGLLRPEQGRVAWLGRPIASARAEYQVALAYAPHEPALKDVEFDRAPFGITGFETALALGLSELVHPGKLSLMRLVELFTTGPARVLGMERKIAAGEPGDLTIFSADHAWSYRAADSPSKSRNTPFDGRAFRGAAMATVVAGRVVFQR